MPDTITEATSQPASTETHPSDASTGKQNADISQFAKLLKSRTPTPAKPQAEVATAAPTETASAEEATASPAETVAEEVTPEVQAETPAPEETAEETADEALSKSNSLTPEQQAIVDKRIGKAVAKQRKAERDAAELKLQLAELSQKVTQPAAQTEQPPAIVPLPLGAPPLANITTVDGLVKLQSEAKEAVRFAEEALDAIRDGQPAPQGWDKASIREVMRNAKLTLEDQIPARAKFLVDQQKATAEAHVRFPWMKDRAAPEYAEAQAIYNRHPYLRNIPEGDLHVGLLLKGLKAVMAEEAAAKTAAAKPKGSAPAKPKPTPGQAAMTSDASAPRVSSSVVSKAQASADRESLSKQGGVTAKGFASFLAKQETLRTQR